MAATTACSTACWAGQHVRLAESSRSPLAMITMFELFICLYRHLRAHKRVVCDEHVTDQRDQHRRGHTSRGFEDQTHNGREHCPADNDDHRTAQLGVGP